MMRRMILVTLCILLAPAVPAGELSPPRSDGLAVLVHVSTGPEAIDSLLVPTVTAHLRQLLRTRGDRFLLRQSLDSDTSRRPDADGYSHLLVIAVDGTIQSRPAVAVDSHRRRYLTSVGDCLDLSLRYTLYAGPAADSKPVRSGSVTAAARLLPRGGPSRQPGVSCEPYDRVIQRALDTLLSPVGVAGRRMVNPRCFIPVIVYYANPRPDSGYASIITRTVERASDALIAQFNTGLRVVAGRYLPEEELSPGSLTGDQGRLNRMLRAGGDTIVVVVHPPAGPEDDDYRRTEVGLSQLGRRFVVMSLLPFSDSVDSVWYPIRNSLTLLHEVGHSFGALHVSDAHSVMSPYTTWTNSDLFDPVNARIVEAALDGRLTFEDPVVYLGFVSGVLASTPYSLADYPSFFHDYLSYGDNRRIRGRLREAIGRQSFLLAVDGYQLLASGKEKAAAQYFRRAMEFDPHQAALYYYLSLAATGEEALEAREAAAGMGYLEARRQARK